MQINLFKIMKYLPYVIAAVLLFFLVNRTSYLEERNCDLLKKAKESDLRAKYYIGQYKYLKQKDSLLELKYDSLNNIRSTIKIKYNERIKIIDKYTVSDMQQFFNERTAEGGDIR